MIPTVRIQEYYLDDPTIPLTDYDELGLGSYYIGRETMQDLIRSCGHKGLALFLHYVELVERRIYGATWDVFALEHAIEFLGLPGTEVKALHERLIETGWIVEEEPNTFVLGRAY